MPKICYIPKVFVPSHAALIEQANTIIDEYTDKGYDLTLRQLYYQFVARDVIPNNMKSYDRLQSVINDARLAGQIDWDAITDRTRKPRSNSHWSSPDEIVEAVADQYQIDKWRGQKWRPEVWVEKDALVGILESVCPDLDVTFFSCRGYTSQSEMWRAARRYERLMNAGQLPVVVHLGDHDPSGVDMSRDIEDRITLFVRTDMGKPDFRLEFHRVALNMDQIEEYNPPPNPAKISDSRCNAYISEYGTESWELDALDPEVLSGIVREQVGKWRNDDKWDDRKDLENKHKEELKLMSDHWREAVEYVTDQQGDTGDPDDDES